MGMIFDIQRFSLHDGPGIRTSVFFSGCNLRCLWCHNPESHEMKPRLGYFVHACTLCGKCAEVCPAGAAAARNGRLEFNRGLCASCFACVGSCVSGARRVIGKRMSAAEVFDIAARDRKYYEKSGGGVTFTGGEPLLQLDFLTELLLLSRDAGIGTAVESALCVTGDSIRRIAPLTDLFMCDIKTMDGGLHKQMTGVSNLDILTNIRLLSRLGADVLIRIPVMEGVNASMENMRLIADFLLNETEIRRVELLKLHTLAAHKYDALGIVDTLSDFRETDDGALAPIRDFLTRKGLEVL